MNRKLIFKLGLTLWLGSIVFMIWSNTRRERQRSTNAHGPNTPSAVAGKQATKSDPVERRRELLAQRGKRRAAPSAASSSGTAPTKEEAAEAPPAPPLLIPEARAEEILSVAGSLSTVPEVERFTEH